MPGTLSPDNDRPRILVSGWAGAGNVGDELLTRAVVTRLRGLGADPVVASQDPEATAVLHGVEAVAWGPRGRRVLDRLDGVCLGPGGILQDSSSLWSLPAHLSVVLLAVRRGLPVAAIGIGAEPLRRRSSAWLLRRALGSAEIIARDEASSAALAMVGLTARTGADVVFGLDLPTPSPTGEIVVSMGGAVRPGLVKPAARRIEPPPLTEIAAAIDSLAARLDAPVVLTRFRGGRDADAAADLRALLRCRANLVPPDVDEHVRRVCGARLVVSSRYHPVVLAARAGVPAVVISTQAKVRSLVAQIDRSWVHLVDSWAAVGDLEPPSPPDEGVVVAGLHEAHEALAALVAHASAARAERSLG
ncbi:MAG: polysaccharide pyruvyl transferase family protein [Acidimicrobiales bacterium]